MVGNEGGGRPGPPLRTVRVPDHMTDVFASAEAVVAQYFAAHASAPERGAIEISGERYVLVRAASLSVEFFALVRRLYGPGREDEADAFARNILFDLAHAIGRSDAKDFHARAGLQDPIARLSAGPVHFAHSGWAFVDISPESNPQPNEDYLLVYDHPYSFEASAWLSAGRAPGFPACVMNAGYSSGWCTESFGLDLVSSEIMCRARGDVACRFVMAQPSRIEAAVASHREKLGLAAARDAHRDPIPDLFARKRMEDELRRSRDELDERVKRRTAELEAANARLEREIAHRVEAEKRLAQSQKLEAVGRLAGGIAHDFNNLLAVVLLRTSIVQGRVSRGDPLWEDMDAIRSACRQGSSLTRHMIAFSRGQPADLRTLDLSDVVRSFAEQMEPLVGSDLTFALELTDRPTYVLADPAQLEQVLINLVLNARDAMPTGGRLLLRTDQRELAGAATTTTTTLARGAYVLLTVEDTGTGMDDTTQSRIFEPFFSTKAPGHGTGLGLSTVYRIVSDARGAIDVESRRGGGTRFTVYLPLIDAPEHAPGSAHEEAPAAVLSPLHRASILLVDDMDDLRGAVEDGLTLAGHAVVAVANPREALALVEEGKISVDILLTDLSMPELGGRELARRVRERAPHVRVLFMSGYDRDADASPSSANPPVLKKPFAIDELLRRIDELRARTPD